jgi:spermidine synthase
LEYREYRLNTRLYALYGLSGFVGVLAEQVFEKLLSVVVGASTPSAATVLAIYFLGLSLGGYCASILLKRKVSAVLGYCIAELGVALCCLWLLLSFDTGTEWYASLIAWGGADTVRLVIARATIASIIILPTALCLGLSFPFLGSLAAQAEENASYYLTKLYCINLFGAALCALAAPFLIFPKVGLSGALVICVAVDASVALYAGWLSRSISLAPQPGEQSSGLQWESSDSMILGVAFISGLLFFALEVIWTHLVGVVIGTSVYAFSSMLFVVLIGLAGGCFQIGRKAHRGTPPARLHGLFFLCASVMLVQVAFWPDGPVWIALLGQHAFNFYSGEGVRLVVLMALLLPATYAYGMIYPSLFQAKRFSRPGAGALLGYMTGANAIGCVLGALAATFLLIPRLGSEWSLRWFTIILALCGITVLKFEGQRLRDGWIAAAVLALLAVAFPAWNRGVLTSGANIYFGHDVPGSSVTAPAASAPATAPSAQATSEITFFHEHSYGGITTVIEYRQPGQPDRHALFTNGKFQGNDWEQQDAQIAFALIPALHLHSRRNALVIGCGTGQSASVLNGLDFKTVDIAEISPGILLAAGSQFRHMNEDVLRSPKVNVHLEDGRNFLLSQPNQYDQITIELTSIWFAGATNLYSREFYELAKHHLSPGGVFQQWFQLHHIGPREIDSIIGTLHASFPYVSAWLYGGQGVLLASLQPQHIEPDAVAAALVYLRKHSVDDATAERTMSAIISSQLLDTGAVAHLAHTGSPIINTDWNRWIEFSTPRYNLSEVDWLTLNRQHLESMALMARVLP